MVAYIKRFSKRSTIKKVGRYIKQHPLLPLSALTASVSTANYATNLRRGEKDKDYQERQLAAMDRLTTSLSKTSELIESTSKEISSDQKKNSEKGNKSLYRLVRISKK